jgi:hypothetical protein
VILNYEYSTVVAYPLLSNRLGSSLPPQHFSRLPSLTTVYRENVSTNHVAHCGNILHRRPLESTGVRECGGAGVRGAEGHHAQ